MKSNEGLTGEPCFPALAFSLKGGDVPYELSCPPSRLLTQAERFITDLVLTLAGRMRILTDEPYFLPQTFSLKGGGVLYEPFCPPLRPLTHGEGSELTSSLLYNVMGRFNCELRYSALAFSLEGEVFSANLPFPIPRLLTQVNIS